MYRLDRPSLRLGTSGALREELVKPLTPLLSAAGEVWDFLEKHALP